MVTRYRCPAAMMSFGIALMMALAFVPVAIVRAQPSAKPVRVDAYGDPLPRGALFRVSTDRLFHDSATRLAFCKDGNTALSISAATQSIRYWNLKSGKLLREVPFVGECHSSIVLSADRKFFACKRIGPFSVDVYSTESGKHIANCPGQYWQFRFAPDNKTLAILNETGTVVHFRWQNSKVVKRVRLEGTQGKPNSFTPHFPNPFSTSCRFIVGQLSGDKSGTVRLWNIHTGKLIRMWRAGQSDLHAVVFCPEDRVLATTEHANISTVRLWALATGKLVKTITEQPKGDANIIPVLTFSPDGKKLVITRGRDSTTEPIRVWDVATGKKCKLLRDQGAWVVHVVAFSHDNNMVLAIHESGHFRVWDLRKRVQYGFSKHHPPGYYYPRFTQDERRVRFTRNSDLKLATVQVYNGKHIGVFDDAYFELSPDGSLLAKLTNFDASYTGLMTMVDRKTDKILWQRKGYRGFGDGMFSNNSKTVVYRSNDGFLCRVHALTGKHIPTFPKTATNHAKHKNRSYIKQAKNNSLNVKCSPDHKYLLTYAKSKGTFLLHDWTTGNVVHSFSMPKEKRDSLHSWFFADGTHVRLFSKLNVTIWDVATGHRITRYDADGVWRKCFDGEWMHIGNPNSQNTKLQSSYTGQVFRQFVSPTEPVITRDGHTLAFIYETSNKRQEVRFYEIVTGKMILAIPMASFGTAVVERVDFSPSGRFLATSDGSGAPLVWDVRTLLKQKRRAPPLTATRFRQLWRTLKHRDAAHAYRAMWELLDAGDKAVPFLNKHLTPSQTPNPKQVARLVAQLDSNNYKTRTRAATQLQHLDGVLPLLYKYRNGKVSLEASLRLRRIITNIHHYQLSPTQLRNHRAVQTLEYIGTKRARQVLRRLSRGAPASWQTRQAHLSWIRLLTLQVERREKVVRSE